MTEIYQLLSQFNFTQQSLYAVGHSILGTYFKGLSYVTNIHGIAFDSYSGAYNVNIIQNPFSKIDIINAENNIYNIYSPVPLISTEDSNCIKNGILPKRYYFPSVYDTACLTAITCSNSMKYVSFCKQILTQNGKNPEKEFNISMNAYLDFYVK